MVGSGGKEDRQLLLKLIFHKLVCFFPEKSSACQDHFLLHLTFSMHVHLPLRYSVPFILTSRGHGFGNLAAKMSLTVRASGSLNLGQFSCLKNPLNELSYHLLTVRAKFTGKHSHCQSVKQWLLKSYAYGHISLCSKYAYGASSDMINVGIIEHTLVKFAYI